MLAAADDAHARPVSSRRAVPYGTWIQPSSVNLPLRTPSVLYLAPNKASGITTTTISPRAKGIYQTKQNEERVPEVTVAPVCKQKGWIYEQGYEGVAKHHSSGQAIGGGGGGGGGKGECDGVSHANNLFDVGELLVRDGHVEAPRLQGPHLVVVQQALHHHHHHQRPATSDQRPATTSQQHGRVGTAWCRLRTASRGRAPVRTMRARSACARPRVVQAGERGAVHNCPQNRQIARIPAKQHGHWHHHASAPARARARAGAPTQAHARVPGSCWITHVLVDVGDGEDAC